MKVLVTGAKGMLGQDLCPLLEDNGYDIIEADIDTLDITDETAVEKKLSDEMPDIIIHCAAYTNVDKAEDSKEDCFNVNVKGTENISKNCAKINATLIYISTDYVFDGTKKFPYEPQDKVNPINYYGQTKMQGEEAVKKYCSKYYITRTSWLYGHHGKNFVETMISLADNPEIKVVNDQFGSPTWTVELANAIIKLLNEDKDFGIYHVCGNEGTTWFEFAKEIFSLMKMKVNLTPCTTEEFIRPAKRPAYSIMNNNGICRDWKSALKDYIELRV